MVPTIRIFLFPFRMTFKTNLDAPNYKVICGDISVTPVQWTEVLPERESVLESVAWVNHDYLAANYLEDVKNVVKVREGVQRLGSY